MISKKTPLNLYEKDFYIDTMHIFQRGDVKEQQKIINFLNKNKKLNQDEMKENFTKFVERLKIESFYDDNIIEKKILNKKDVEDLINDYIDKFFTEKSRFNKYMSEVYELNEFKTYIDDFFQTNKKLDTKDKIVSYLFDKTEEFKKEYSEKAKNKVKGKKSSFYLDRTVSEKYSRNTRIFQKLQKFKVNESVYEKDFSLYLSSLGSKIVKNYSENISNISSSNLLDQIVEVSLSSQKFAQLFDDVKKDVVNKENRMYDIFTKKNPNLKSSDLNELNKLEGKTIETKGKDFFERLIDKLKLIDDSLKTERKRNTGVRKVFNREKIKSGEINNNSEFRKNLRELLLSVIKSSSIQSNIDNYQKPFFFDKLKYPKIPEFAYQKEVLNNPLNISIQAKTKNDENINMTILSILLEVTENKGKIYPYISEEIRDKINKFLEKNKVEKEFLQKSLLDIINYELYLDKNANKIISKIESGEKVNLKDEIDINNKEDLIDDYYLLIDFVKNAYKLNTLLKFNKENQKNAVSKIKIFNPTFENNKKLLHDLPITSIEDFSKFSKKEIDFISSLDLSVIDYYEEKEIEERLLELETNKKENQLDTLFKG